MRVLKKAKKKLDTASEFLKDEKEANNFKSELVRTSGKVSSTKINCLRFLFFFF